MDRPKESAGGGGAASGAPAPERDAAAGTTRNVLRDADQFEPAVNEFRGKVAARKIQKTFREFQAKEAAKSPLVDSKAKAVIEREMKVVNSIIEHSGVAHLVNLRGVQPPQDQSRELQRKIQDMNQRQSRINWRRKDPSIVSKMAGFIDDRLGNCAESAQLLGMFLKQSGELGDSLKSKVRVAALQTPEDHSFVIVGDPASEDECLVVDPWIMYLDLPATPGFRPEAVPADARDRGFMGSLKQYLVFLEAHADGHYVIKGCSHELMYVAPRADENEREQIVAFARQKLEKL